MPFPQLSPTNAGKAMLLAACAGYPLKFTKIVLGNGNQPANQDLLTLVQNPQAEAVIATHTRTGTHSKVHWHLDSEAVENSFDWTEYGVYATNTLDGNGDPIEGTDVLFSYAYNEGSPQPIVPQADTPVLLEGDLNIAVGSAEHVSAVVSEYSAYASKEAFNEHISARNPHGTLAEDVGLGHVDDTSDSDAMPEFEEAKSLENISSGETASTLWGKVMKLFSSYIAHLKEKNPHGAGPSDIGAAAKNHKHSAGDITSGVLNQKNGGTGYSSLAGFLSAAHLTNAKIHYFSGRAPDGGFEIIFDNKMVIGCGCLSGIYADANSSSGGSLDFGANYFAQAPIVVCTDYTSIAGRHASVTGSSRRGFDIGFFNQTNKSATNSIYYIYMGFVTNLPY